MKSSFDYLTIIISVFALTFSVWQFFCERIRARKEATIHSFDELEADESVIYLLRLSKREIETILEAKKSDNIDNDEWFRISKALALIEHFSVGVNNKIYDLKVLNSMAGNKMIDTYDKSADIIKYKRKDSEKNYSEFESMVNSLKNYRRKHK